MRCCSRNDTFIQPLRARAGFTLIELLFVTAIMAVVSLATYAVFNNGIKIWQRINKPLGQENVLIFADKFCRDLHNSLNFKGIPFSGRGNALAFAALVTSPRLKNTTVGRLSYSYEPQAQLLSRKQDDYSQVYSGGQDSPVQSLSNVTSFKFQYYVFDPDNKQYFWQDEWVKDSPPLAVRMELEIEDGNRIRKFIQTVNIPVAG